jgi:phosphocarrier protein FPr
LANDQVGANEAAIFKAHLLFLQDPVLVDGAREQIYGSRINAEAAWQNVIVETADDYRKLEDAYMQARADDILDVGNRVLQHLMAVERPSIDIDHPSILVAPDLTPSDTANLDPDQILAICTEFGGATSHSAILARALGIPAVVGLGPALESVKEDQLIIVDGERGLLILEPTDEEQKRYLDKRTIWLEERAKAKAGSKQPATTRDGRSLEIVANIGSPHDASVALDYGAEGVGLFRTEFLFLQRDALPNEEEQFKAYNDVAALMGNRPLIIRTLDVGGDKPLPYLEMNQDDNPCLGRRGIRFWLDQPAIFRPQLRAILRASFGHNVKVMFPMISTVEELKAAKELFTEICEELTAEGVPVDEQMEVGIMIEVPSAVAVADRLALEADFFSIGTNDLTQYVMAADRGNPQVSGLANALQPAVLRMIQQTVQAAKIAGKWVGLCGELAGNRLAVPLLVGLKLDELSMNSNSIPGVKKAIRELTVAEAEDIARRALMMDSVADVEAFLARV